MSSYQTVPDLESEAQPLVAAPPRKLGKTLVVVALFGFAAGAAVATAAPHVAAKMNLVAGGEDAAWGATGARASTANDYILDENGTPTEGVAGETDTDQFQIVPADKQNAAAASTGCGPGGETATTNPDCFDATIQGAQNGPDLGV